VFEEPLKTGHIDEQRDSCFVVPGLKSMLASVQPSGGKFRAFDCICYICWSVKTYPMFSLTNIIVFCKYEPILILMAATHPKNVVTETK